MASRGNSSSRSSSSSSSSNAGTCRRSLRLSLLTSGDPEDLFRIRALVGEGSYGLVYLAEVVDPDGASGPAGDAGGALEVAIKVVPCSASAEKELRILRLTFSTVISIVT
jgi:serine/threonine protein kinase